MKKQIDEKLGTLMEQFNKAKDKYETLQKQELEINN